jgi:hypothetical protein
MRGVSDIPNYLMFYYNRVLGYMQLRRERPMWHGISLTLAPASLMVCVDLLDILGAMVDAVEKALVFLYKVMYVRQVRF